MRIEGTTPSWEHSVRGVHLIPGSYQAGWMRDAVKRASILKLLKDMHISWVMLLTAGDSCLEVFDGFEVVRWFLENQIVPVIRDSPPEATALPRPFMNMATVERAVAIYGDYGIKPCWKLWNEPGDGREWRKGKAPPDWWPIFVERFNAAADIVLRLGAVPLFPDGPGYDFIIQHPFRDVDKWDQIGYAIHNYSKGRPLNYPYDSVSQVGFPVMTEAQLSLDLDDFAPNQNWRQPTVETMNRQRLEWADPGKTAIEDPTCFNEWVQIDHHARKTLGHPVVQFMAEGGWVAKDRAGSNPTDDRWALTTPKKVADLTLAMWSFDGMPQYTDEEGVPYPSPFQAMMPWTFASSALGAGGWEDDSWYGGSYFIEYGIKKPIIQAAIDNPPGKDCAWTKARKSVERIVGILT